MASAGYSSSSGKHLPHLRLHFTEAGRLAPGNPVAHALTLASKPWLPSDVGKRRLRTESLQILPRAISKAPGRGWLAGLFRERSCASPRLAPVFFSSSVGSRDGGRAGDNWLVLWGRGRTPVLRFQACLGRASGYQSQKMTFWIASLQARGWARQRAVPD